MMMQHKAEGHVRGQLAGSLDDENVENTDAQLIKMLLAVRSVTCDI